LGVSPPPQTIISVPVQTAEWRRRASGALAVLVAAQEFVASVYTPPVFVGLEGPPPPQTIISVPVQTARWYILADGVPPIPVAVQLLALVGS
jgi:hypothetical protein